MAELLSVSTIEELAKRFKEPAWLTELRRSALKQHEGLPWPHPSDEIWRRTDVTPLDPMQGFALPDGPGLLEGVRLSHEEVNQFVTPLADEHLIVRANGSWVTQQTPTGLQVLDLAQAAEERPRLIRQVVEADGLTQAEQKLASLNAAFHHDDMVVQVDPHVDVDRPLRLVHLATVAGRQACFPLTVIVVGQGSSIVLIDEYVGGVASSQATEPHVINTRVELLLEPQATVHYVRLQRWGAGAREFLLQRATLLEGAQLVMVNLTLGSSVSKAHVITKLLGPRATSKLYGFVFGRGRQHVDQHTLQDHQAPQTVSDLLFKAALKDASRLVYTGLIRIAKQAKQTEAYQANHNLLLSETAKAETIPMLEILADDVRCKHGVTIGPIDDEQAFYLMTRGLPRELAERLIVMGFVEQIVQQIPFEPLQQRLREEIEVGLHQ